MMVELKNKVVLDVFIASQFRFGNGSFKSNPSPKATTILAYPMPRALILLCLLLFLPCCERPNAASNLPELGYLNSGSPWIQSIKR